MPDENELYEQWRSASEGERWEVEGKLFQRVLSHMCAVVCETLHEWNPDVVQDAALAVWRGLSRFRRESTFSTWVHSIAKHKTYAEIRRRVRRRRVFDECKVVVANPAEDEEERDHEVCPINLPDLEGPMAFVELCKELPQDDASLVEYKREGMSADEIAAKMGIGQEAVDSRWARLKRSVQDKLLLRRRLDGASSY